MLSRSERARRVGRLVTVLALAAACAALAGFVDLANQASEPLRGLLGPDDPDLAFAEPILRASAFASTELVISLVLLALVVVRARRIAFAMTAAWSVALFVTTLSVLAPEHWGFVVVGLGHPTSQSNLGSILTATAVICLVASIVAWWNTAPRRGWLSVPFRPGRPLPPQSKHLA